MKNIFFLIGFLSLGFVLTACTKPNASTNQALLNQQVNNSQQPINQNTNTTPDNQDTNQNANSRVKEFTVTGGNFKFSLNEIKVKEGDTVKIKFVNNEGFHDWVLDEFNAKTDRLQAGQDQTIEFVANKKGTFEYYCSVGTHRQMGMKGNLIVE